MYDPNIQDFYERVGRLNKAHARGLGFEAEGLRGRSYYRRPKRISVLRPLLLLVFLAAVGFGLKGTAYHVLGPHAFAERVASLQVDEAVSGRFLSADPVTQWVARAIERAMTLRG
ncbi:hypothetical protein EOK75_05035 [Pseudorhodobacter turbinis]|uniref:Uncharacterized protein n=1 Tax=Pseudorhodobacter turbinis TaxID=2500533 RepID=A0A4P8EEL7_9RHOB|nr:hypothetical protein [Pseudorhodobacter turbinis]QCO55192.1 hypothetical protein EOK75_05035 [Pseudorhodobacter turbinis]